MKKLKPSTLLAKRSKQSLFSYFDLSFLWLAPYFVFAIFFTILSLFLLFTNSFSASSHSLKLVSNSTVLWILIRSIWTSILASIIAVVVSLLYLWFTLQITSKIIRNFLIFSLTLPFFIFTISKIWALKGLFLQMFSPDTLNSYWFMILGMVYLNLPLASIPIYGVLRDIPRGLIEASFNLGYGPVPTFFKVVVPYSLKAIFKSFAVVFLTSSMFILVSEKLLPNGEHFTMIANIIYEFTHSFNKYDFSQITLLVVLTLLVLILVCSLCQFLVSVFYSLKNRRSLKLLFGGKHVKSVI